MTKIFGKDQISIWISALSEKILNNHLDGTNLSLIGMRTRGEFIARRLQKNLEAKTGKIFQMGILDVSFYRDDTRSKLKQPVIHSTEIPFDLQDKKIILIDDVVFTGRSVRAALDEIMDYGRPSKIELAVLIDRGGRELPIEPNYVEYRVSLSESQSIRIHLNECDGEDGVFQS